jgi:uncharacterized repeat protein (TIGR01451 family)
MRTYIYSGVAACLLMFGLIASKPAFAATSPSIGSDSSYAIISSTFTNSLNTGLETAIKGNVCYATPPATAPVSISGTTTVACPSATGDDQALALANLNAQANAVSCTNLGTNVVLAGTYAPGCYTASGTIDIALNTTVTLSGSGTYIFRASGALTTGANSKVVLTNGALAGDVFWVSNGGVHLGANDATSTTPTFAGNIIDPSGITIGHFANLLGRALAFGGTVTTDSNTIIAPSTIEVVKTVMNDNGGNKTVADFPLFVNGAPVVSGAINAFLSPAAYTITETTDPNYAQSFSGDCDVNGHFNLAPGDNKICSILNDDIAPPPPPVPPLIDVVKVPNPLALPAGPGLVTYSYTLRNIGTVPVTNITMVDDSCAPVNFVSGDTNGDSILDITETWTYSCSKTLAATQTNTVTATGMANGLTATDTASATVVVGVPVVPPLIHVTKVPSPLTLLAGGGMVTYTETITNPGTVPLSNVSLTDDKCTPMAYVSGDTNGNSLLDLAESWVYTCQTNIIQSTTNTATASGDANGLTATDHAFATVSVAAYVQLASRFSPVGTITVVDHVINDNGLTKTIADFPLFVNGIPVVSGATNIFSAPANVYKVTETSDPNYTQTFSGDCDVNGEIGLSPGDQKICIVTNDDIGTPVIVPPVPPLIDVVKVPNPLALPAGPGSVTYTYTLKNIGTVPISNVTMVDDTCSAITLVSGDVNGDAKLDTTETWTYTCTANLAQTTTNTVVATGWANGISATDIANATVVVGAPVVPPLIHVTKIPSPLALLAGGGKVTYTEKITNPGTVALSSVTLADDKCGPMKYISGDANGDSKLDPTETWTYTCTANLAKTTTNTATATGTANGMTIKDVAIATVIVAASAVPGLPKAGVSPMGNILPLDAIVAGLGLAAFFLLLLTVRKKLLE